MLVVLVSAANALADECQSDFERWVALSQSRLRVHQQSNAACLPNEAVRQELLSALMRAAAKCQPDQSTQHTRTMIGINQGFVGSLPVCGTEEPPTQTAKTPPSPPQPQKPSRPCLEISRITPERYVVANRHCADSKVLAIVEIKQPTGEIACKGHTIEKRLVLTTQNALRPQLNYECPLTAAKCTKELLSQMFPECDW